MVSAGLKYSLLVFDVPWWSAVVSDALVSAGPSSLQWS